MAGQVTAAAFGRAMVRSAKALLETFGVDGYAERWTSFGSDEPLPRRALAALEAALAQKAADASALRRAGLGAMIGA